MAKKNTKTTTKAPKANAKKAGKAAKPVAEPKAKKVSALDAAHQVLLASTEPMNCQDLIKAMA